MKEEILKQFFEGKTTAEKLGADIEGSTRCVGDLVSYQSVEDMEGDFRVLRSHLLRVCDAVLSGKLLPKFLGEIGFALVASDHFFWDGDEDEILADVIYDWSCPEVNYPLTLENVQRFKSWLTEEEPYPPKPSTLVSYEGKLISVSVKKSIERNRAKKLWHYLISRATRKP
jgi:hypothetical protein